MYAGPGHAISAAPAGAAERAKQAHLAGVHTDSPGFRVRQARIQPQDFTDNTSLQYMMMHVDMTSKTML